MLACLLLARKKKMVSLWGRRFSYQRGPWYFSGCYFPSPFTSCLIEDSSELSPGLCHLTFCPIGCLRSAGWGMGEGERACRGRRHTLIPGIFYFSLSSHYFKRCLEVAFPPLSAAGSQYSSAVHFVRFGVGKGLGSGFILPFYPGSL